MQLALDRRPNTARFSPDEVHRYTLTRELGGDRPLVVCGLNPSTATAETDDPTIRKECGFAARWMCGMLYKVNAHGYRATDPRAMRRASKLGIDVVGRGGGTYPDGGIDFGNDYWIRHALDLVREVNGIFLVAWGANLADYPGRQAELAEMIAAARVTPLCLGINLDGSPVHPLYQPYDRELRPWAMP